MKLSNIMYILGFASILTSAASFTAGKVDGGEGDKGGEEKQRSGLFVGFWPPTFFIWGKSSKTAKTAARTSSAASKTAKGKGTRNLRRVPFLFSPCPDRYISIRVFRKFVMTAPRL